MASETQKRLWDLGYRTVHEYEQGPQWEAARLRYRCSDRPWTCHICGCEYELELHHRTYERVGDEPLGDLVPLCEWHHHEVERRVRKFDWPRSEAHELYRLEYERRSNQALRRLDVSCAIDDLAEAA